MSYMNLLYGLNRLHRVGRIKVQGPRLVFKQLYCFWTVFCTIRQITCH